MDIFARSHTRRLLWHVALLLLLLNLAGQAAAVLVASEYKQGMIAHDYALAGYLAQHDRDETGIIAAFTAAKTPADEAAGQALLRTAGYTPALDNALIPEIAAFQRKCAGLALALTGAISLAILVTVGLFSLRFDRRLQNANAAIQRLIDGDTGVRLAGQEEDNLSQLFASVNDLAASLATHAARQQHDKEFLKDTISDISHQLKTPLAALQMYNDIIQGENSANPVIHDFILKSKNELERMESLIQNLLKLARLDAGAIQLERQDHPLSVLLTDAAGRFSARAAAENKTLTLDCPAHIVLNCDKIWLLEALSNLIKNALEHTAAGSHIAITCDETPLMTRITIRDDGPGIHPEDIHFIFKRFYRSRFSKNQQGAGIGLALVKIIVEKHGGTIQVESQPGQGAAFHLTFPRLTNL